MSAFLVFNLWLNKRPKKKEKDSSCNWHLTIGAQFSNSSFSPKHTFHNFCSAWYLSKILLKHEALTVHQVLRSLLKDTGSSFSVSPVLYISPSIFLSKDPSIFSLLGESIWPEHISPQWYSLCWIKLRMVMSNL